MRQAEKEKNKFYSRIPFILDPGKKIPKKILKKLKKLKKNLFPILFFAQTGLDRLRKRKKKILLPNSVQTRHGQENSEKNSKKIEKTKKPLSDIISRQNWLRWAEKKRKKIYPRIPFVLDPGQKIPKKMTKKFFAQMPFILDPAKKIPKKIVKKLKKFKTHFPTLFLAKTG